MWTSQRIWNWPASYWSDGAAPHAVAVDHARFPNGQVLCARRGLPAARSGIVLAPGRL